jgi:hypothetical protein
MVLPVLPASAGAVAAKVLVCFFCIMLFVKSPLGGAKPNCHKGGRAPSAAKKRTSHPWPSAASQARRLEAKRPRGAMVGGSPIGGDVSGQSSPAAKADEIYSSIDKTTKWLSSRSTVAASPVTCPSS